MRSQALHRRIRDCREADIGTAPSIERLRAQNMIDRSDARDRIDPTLADEPTDSTEFSERMDRQLREIIVCSYTGR
ncbi:MAG: hypothetical protein JWN20_1855 [Jatrophihabitantaceae bacterium]|nr:hypothetical protein [Jatrophihabitantaceae bacterium]